MATDPRYDGKPLLRLLECYVLSAIGKLPQTDARTLEDLAPKLNEVYGRAGAWQEVLRSVMEIPADADGRMRLLWGTYAEKASLEGQVLEAETFARQFVDQNFSI